MSYLHKMYVWVKHYSLYFLNNEIKTAHFEFTNTLEWAETIISTAFWKKATEDKISLN